MKALLLSSFSIVSLTVKKWLCTALEDHIYYHTRTGERTRWVSREEWFRELKQNQSHKPYDIFKETSGE